jgi:hypothetical protein
MRILFPNHPLKSRLPDPDYQTEFDAARNAGFECELYSLEDLRAGDATLATQRCAAASSDGEAIVHRGWMMSDSLYAALFTALAGKGYRPVTTPEQYAQAHYLPNAYSLLEGRTPESVWVEGKDVAGAWQKYEQLGRPAAIVKDFVKSAKHRWNEACFIPAGTERTRFDEIMAAFLQARGSLFEKGIVLRRFHEFVKLATDIRGQPVHEEYRLFMWDGALLAATPSIRGAGPFEQIEEWQSIAQGFGNRFISMDIARQQDGSWLIVEVGDGGVSGLPTSIEPETFYKTLRERCVPGDRARLL